MFEAGVLADAQTVGNFQSDPGRRRARRQPAERCRLRGAAGELADDQHRRARVQTYERAFGTTLVTEERPAIKQRGHRGARRRSSTRPTTTCPASSRRRARASRRCSRASRSRSRYTSRRPNAFPPPGATGTSTCRPTCRSAATPTRRTAPGSRATACASRWSTRAGSRTRSSPSAATGSSPTVLGPGTADPTSTRTATARASRPTSSRPRPTAALLPVKAATASGALVNMTAAFNAAVALDPDIITNSWTVGASRTGR